MSSTVLHARAKAMRKLATPPEQKLWQALRAWQLHGLKFRRQMPIGPYIADFYCSTARLVIEIDGATHADCEHDIRRDAWLRAQGLRVLHVWNNDVMGNLEGVLAVIAEAAATPPPGPLPRGEGESSELPPPLAGGGRGEGSA